MIEKKKSMIIFSLKLLIPIIIVIVLFLGGINAGVITFEKEKTNTGEITATLKIDFGDGNFFSDTITLDNSTVYDFLLEVEKKGEISIETTYWESFDSYTVGSITYNGKKYESDMSRYWAFYVNNNAGMEGADKVYLEDNDIIEWKLETF
jgi:hypothetical protein